MLYTKMNVTRCMFDKDDVSYIIYIIEKEGTLDFYIQGSKYDDNLYHTCYVSNKNLVDNFDNNIDEWIKGIEKKKISIIKMLFLKKERLYL